MALPDGYALQEAEDPASVEEIDPERRAVGDGQQRFWAEFVDGLELDDPEQPKPRPARVRYITLPYRRAPAGLRSIA